MGAAALWGCSMSLSAPTAPPAPIKAEHLGVFLLPSPAGAAWGADARSSPRV